MDFHTSWSWAGQAVILSELWSSWSKIRFSLWTLDISINWNTKYALDSFSYSITRYWRIYELSAKGEKWCSVFHWECNKLSCELSVCITLMLSGLNDLFTSWHVGYLETSSVTYMYGYFQCSQRWGAAFYHCVTRQWWQTCWLPAEMLTAATDQCALVKMRVGLDEPIDCNHSERSDKAGVSCAPHPEEGHLPGKESTGCYKNLAEGSYLSCNLIEGWHPVGAELPLTSVSFFQVYWGSWL